VAEVRLRNGTRLWGGGRVLCAHDGRLVNRKVSDVAAGDWVGLSYGEGFSSLPQTLLPMTLSPPHGSQKRVRLPFVMDRDLALLLGMYAAEGHTNPSNYTIIITNSEEVVLERCRQLWQACFGLEARITRQPGKCPGVQVASKTVVEFMSHLGCGARASDKRIPTAVMCSPETVVLAFLQGLALDAYTSSTGPYGKWAICLDSSPLLDDFQTVLRHLGFLSGRISKYNPVYGKSYDEVFLSGGEAQRFLRLVPFLEKGKQASADRLLERPVESRRNGSDVVPLVKGADLYAEIPKGRGGRNGAGTGVSITWRALVDKRTIWPSRWIVEQLAAAHVRLPDDVTRVLDENLHFSPVRACAEQGAPRRSNR
jgi:hypothetical protein